ncbi:hypothetical protein LDENG_00017130 [Lucifuga dentata]|nr:hypothetical protein LDENG_00017130 [Lucifuga dentata]
MRRKGGEKELRRCWKRRNRGEKELRNGGEEELRNGGEEEELKKLKKWRWTRSTVTICSGCRELADSEVKVSVCSISGDEAAESAAGR